MDENLSLSNSGKERKIKKDNNKRSFKQFITDVFNEYKNEYQKIIWPSRKELIKQTILVITVCAIFAVIIYILDMGFSAGHRELIQLFVRQSAT